MLVFAAGALEARHLHRALAAYIQRMGPRQVPPRLVAMLDDLQVAISTPKSPLAATSVEPEAGPSHGDTVTYTQAAELLAVSPRTVSRRVADGDLERRGRRITLASIHRHLEQSHA